MKLKRLPFSFRNSIVFLVFVSAVAWAKPDAILLAKGQAHFVACSACHGADGKGMKIGELSMGPNLYESQIVKGDPSALALVVMKGIKKENDTYVQQMLALQDAMDDKQLAEVLTYVRHTFGESDKVVKPKEVKAWRKSFAKVPVAVPRKDVDGIVVRSKGPKVLVSDLTYKMYKGKWGKLPDFDKLEVKEEGEIKSSLIDIFVQKERGEFGMVFEGTLTLPKEDTYEFKLASDDGSDLWIDGKKIVDNDGTHPVTVKTGNAKLAGGDHKMVVRFFESGGGEDLMLSVKAKALGGEVKLSKKAIGAKAPKPPPKVIAIVPENEGEAIMYRNFIAGANPRGIAVGYPGGVNICWDADVMNLALIWKGDFMNAGRHWSGRGQGAQPPMGTGVQSFGKDGFPLAVAPADGESNVDGGWQDGAFMVPFKYGENRVERTEEKTFIGRHPDYTFKGYRLDAKRFPTFSYTYKGLAVTDGFAPGADGALVRTLTFTGTPAAGTRFRVGSGVAEVDGGDAAFTRGPVTITAEGATASLEGANLVVPIKGATTLTLTYAW